MTRHSGASCSGWNLVFVDGDLSTYLGGAGFAGAVYDPDFYSPFKVCRQTVEKKCLDVSQYRDFRYANNTNQNTEPERTWQRTISSVLHGRTNPAE